MISKRVHVNKQDRYGAYALRAGTLFIALSSVSHALATPPVTAPSAQVTTEGVTPPATLPADQRAEQLGAKAVVERQVQGAVDRLKRLSPGLKLTQRVTSLSPNLALRMDIPLEGAGGRERAQNFVERFSDLWVGLQVEVSDASTRRFKTYATLKASIAGRPVLNQDARLLIDQEGHARQLSSALSAVYQLRRATLTEAEATRAALTHLQLSLDAPYVARLGYLIHAGVATAAYEIQAGGVPAQSQPVVLVDAVEGGVLNVTDRVMR